MFSSSAETPRLNITKAVRMIEQILHTFLPIRIFLSSRCASMGFLRGNFGDDAAGVIHYASILVKSIGISPKQRLARELEQTTSSPTSSTNGSVKLAV
jgi:hypothetical protein